MSVVQKVCRQRRIQRGVLMWTLLILFACGGPETGDTPENGPAQGEDRDVVRLDSLAIAIANITVVTVDTVLTTSLPVTGTITYDANRVSHIGPRIESRIVRLLADVGGSVASGQALAILESIEIGRLRAEEEEAIALLKIARENFEREQRLEQQGISSRKERLDAEANLRRMEAALNSARQRLQVLGAGQGQGGQYSLTAPFQGVVVQRHATLGEMAGPVNQLFTIANLSQLWIELDIYERDISRVRLGQTVSVMTAAYPGRNFPGEIAYVGDILDSASRTVRVRVVIPNVERILKPGMFATANIHVDRGGIPLIVIPEESVQQVDGRTVVFVPGNDPGEFRVVPIEAGETTDEGRTIVRAGLKAGDRVVSNGAFALRSELARNEIGQPGHGH